MRTLNNQHIESNGCDRSRAAVNVQLYMQMVAHSGCCIMGTAARNVHARGQHRRCRRVVCRRRAGNALLSSLCDRPAQVFNLLYARVQKMRWQSQTHLHILARSLVRQHDSLTPVSLVYTRKHIAITTLSITIPTIYAIYVRLFVSSSGEFALRMRMLIEYILPDFVGISNCGWGFSTHLFVLFGICLSDVWLLFCKLCVRDCGIS